MFFCLFLSSAISTSNAAAAQERAADSRRQYLVEVIVFKHEGPDSSSGELWTAREFELPAPPQPKTAPNPIPVEYTELKHLNNALQALRTDARYRPLTYRAWLQPLSGRNQAPKVPISAPSSFRAGVYAMSKPLDGSLRVFESHLLFVEVDLTARFGHGEPSFTTARPGVDAGTPATFDRGPTAFRISEKRRVKLNEEHYFDHPKFGALVRVSRADTSATVQ